MNFKEALAHDARSVFLNPDEFGEAITIDGVATVGIWDASQQALGGASQSDPTGWGVVSVSSVLFVAEESILCPLPDEVIVVNGNRYTVIKAESQAGILRLELERKAA